MIDRNRPYLLHGKGGSELGGRDPYVDRVAVIEYRLKAKG
jgi:hypothetical protein